MPIGEIIVTFEAKVQSTALARLVGGWSIEKSTPETSGGGLRVLLDRRGAGRVVSEDKEDGEDRDDEDEAEDGDDADGTDGARMDLASSSGMPRITLSGGGSAEVRPWAPLLARWSAISFPRNPSCPGTQMKEKGVVVLRVRRLLRSLLANFLPLRVSNGLLQC